MNDRPLLLLGTGPFAEDVADMVAETPGWRVDKLVDSIDRTRAGEAVAGIPIVWIDDLAGYVGSHHALGALGTTKRRAFVEQVAALGIPFATIVHPSARISTSAKVAEGTLVSRGCLVAARATIGRHVLLNRGSTIGHHTAVADYVTVGPGTHIASSVHVRTGTYIGIGATVIDHLEIGAGSIVAAGAVVTRDVPERVLVAGVPARVVKRDVDGF
jgi:sugar O-acyltransferase (sialic acid O-acetyltransferase NeuD family)